MEALKIKGNVTVAGMEIPNIVGGFGYGKKAMLAKHVAAIHRKELRAVNQAINMNRDRFRDGVDVIDLLNQSDGFRKFAEENGFVGSNRTEHVYLLSERGYAKLIKIFDDDKSWGMYDQLLDEYFELRDGNVTPIEELSSAELLMLYAKQFLEQDRRVKAIEKRQHRMDGKVAHIQRCLTETPDRKKIQRELHVFARRNNLPYAEAITHVYKTLEDKHSIDIKQRVRNKWHLINADRSTKGKKPYAESTLKQRYNGMNVIIDLGYTREVMEILAGLA